MADKNDQGNSPILNGLFLGGYQRPSYDLSTIFSRTRETAEEARQRRCLVHDNANPFALPWVGETYMPQLQTPTNPTSPENVRKALHDAHFNENSIELLAGTKHRPGVNPELALVAARAKQIYEAAHPGRSFEVEQGFRTRQDQVQIAALGSAFTNASGKKGHESPHQFGQAFDFHIYERQRNGQWIRQPNERENDNDYRDAANAMKKAAQELGYGNKLNYGALGDVHVGHGKTRHNDWGHIEEKRSFWNQWHPQTEQPNHPPKHTAVHPAEHHTSHHRRHHHHQTTTTTTPTPSKPK